MSKRAIAMMVGALLAGLVGGLWLGHGTGHSDHRAGATPGTGSERAIKFWSCSMHPQIEAAGPGQCPRCGMDLIPVYADDGDQPVGPRQIKLSATAQKLAEVVATPVRRQFVTMPVRLVGKIEYDETKLAYITAWVPGRLDRLYVDYTGVPVNKGDHMVYLYSPELLAAQEELIQSLITLDKIKTNAVSLIRDRAAATIDASRDKLRLLGLTPDQIKEIERSGQPQDHLTIYAPVSGIVIHKNALEGMYVQTGSRIYTIADLTQVWVKLDAYESDLAWIHYGQEVEFETEAYPGEVFTGRIAFIDPVLDSKTRTVKVRVNVPNLDGRLKPEMFVRAIVRSRVAAEGKIIDPSLADKFICPMHPEIVKPQPGTCDICGMDLVSAESLGYVSASASQAEPPLVVPATAPLITGQRAVVYVAVPDQAGVFEGREIVLGPRAGKHYIVRDGLREGEEVVVHGAFMIDSAVQIQAKPSMMSLPVRPAAPVLSRDQLDRLLSPYLDVQRALAKDDFAAAKQAAGTMPHLGYPSFDDLVRQLAATETIEAARAAFGALSTALVDALQVAPNAPGPLYVLHCPMAFENQGADWLQADDQTRNPYFGAAMLRCGKVTEKVGTRP